MFYLSVDNNNSGVMCDIFRAEVPRPPPPPPVSQLEPVALDAYEKKALVIDTGMATVKVCTYVLTT